MMTMGRAGALLARLRSEKDHSMAQKKEEVTVTWVGRHDPSFTVGGKTVKLGDALPGGLDKDTVRSLANMGRITCDEKEIEHLKAVVEKRTKQAAEAKKAAKAADEMPVVKARVQADAGLPGAAPAKK